MRNICCIVILALGLFMTTCTEEEEILITISDFNVEIEENPTNGSILGRIEATVNQGQIRFLILEQEPNEAISINESTGELAVRTASLFDYETHPIITGLVQVTTADISETGTISITLANVEETILTVSDFNIEIDENPVNGESLGTIEASTSEGELSFVISEQQPTNAMQINETTGVLSVLNADLFDYETNPVITALVKVSSGNASEDVAISIVLKDTDETMISATDFMLEIDENPVDGQSLGTIEASTSEGELSFVISEQQPINAMQMNETTGELSVLNADLFDYETNPVITALVKVSSGNASEDVAISIVLKDVDETMLTASDFSVTINENPERNQSLGFIEVETNIPDISFGLLDGRFNDAIDLNPSTGEITVAGVGYFNFERTSLLTFKAIVKADNKEEIIGIRIVIRDVLEAVLTASDFETTIQENPTDRTSLGFIEASTTLGEIRFVLQTQNSPNALSVDSSTGEVLVEDGTVFDFEGNNPIEATVTLFNESQSESISITVNLLDVDENEGDLQSRLDSGETPFQIYQSNNALLEELYGLNYQGGLIFYLDTDTGQGMVAAPNDEGKEVWGCIGTNITDAENAGIGAGKTNTAAIVDGCNENQFAAKTCDDLVLDGYEDWFLPSLDELNLMYQNLHLKGIGNFNTGSVCCGGFYWSSTEPKVDNSPNHDVAWVQSFKDGFQATYDIGIKSFENNVRAARIFN